MAPGKSRSAFVYTVKGFFCFQVTKPLAGTSGSEVYFPCTNKEIKGAWFLLLYLKKLLTAKWFPQAALVFGRHTGLHGMCNSVFHLWNSSSTHSSYIVVSLHKPQAFSISIFAQHSLGAAIGNFWTCKRPWETAWNTCKLLWVVSWQQRLGSYSFL